MNTNSNDKHCDYNNFKRDRYFHGMLMTDRDFKEEQIYHNEKRKLHNRYLHGWGVVCGLGIKASNPVSSVIKITRGMALDCLGNEIMVCNDFEIDIKQTDISTGTKVLCDTKEKVCKYYIAIKYIEESSDSVPVYAPSGGCEEKVCEYSRIREGFCVKLVPEIPCTNVVTTNDFYSKVYDYLINPGEVTKSTICETIFPCPVCCCKGEPFVVLGSITFKGPNCTITNITQGMISINDGRRYVFTPMLWQHFARNTHIGKLLENPFIIFCQPAGGSIPRPASIAGASILLPSINRSTLEQLKSVSKMKEEDAQGVLKEQGVDYNNTISLSSDNAPDILMRAITTEKIEPGMMVDLVTDNSGMVLFYVPAAEVPEKVELDTLIKRLNESDLIIKQLNTRIDTIEKRKGK